MKKLLIALLLLFTSIPAYCKSDGFYNVLQAPNDVDKRKPTDTQVLAWNAGTNLWTPTTPSAGSPQTPWASNINGAGYSLYGVPKLYPSSDSTTAFGIFKANGTTNVVNVDTTNGRVGIGTTSPTDTLNVNGGITLDGSQTVQSTLQLIVKSNSSYPLYLRSGYGEIYLSDEGSDLNIGSQYGLSVNQNPKLKIWGKNNSTTNINYDTISNDSSGYLSITRNSITDTLGTHIQMPLTVDGQITSGVTTGTAPFVTTSTTPVANLSIGGNAATVTGLSVTGGKTLTAQNNITFSGTDGVAMNVTNEKATSFGITIDGGGSAITTGVKGYITIPYACTITGWDIAADGVSPTCTFDVWKIATGTALPTVANTIMGTKPALSTGNVKRSTTLTSWTTAVAAGDIIGFNVDAVTVATKITFQIEVNKT